MALKLKNIKLNPNNPRLIKDDKFKKLVKSLQDFPEMMAKRPMVCVTDTDGKIYPLGGNMRLKALQELKYKEIPDEWVMMADDWTKEQRREFLIKDNIGFGEWDWDEIANNWDAEQLTDWGLDIPDFNPTVLEAEEDDYEIPDVIETDIVLGDLFEIGVHRLLCGDSTNSDDVARLMNGQKADMVFTSPPYNQGNGGMKYDYNGDVKKLYQDKTDKKTKEEYFDFIISILSTVYTITNQDATILWNVMYNANARDDYGKIIFSEVNPFSVKETIIWDKGHAFPTASKGILSRRCELIFLMSSGEKYYTNQGENEPIDNYWNISSQGAQHENHKACFPIGLPEKGITQFSTIGATVYEPFTGSGTTMVASEQLKRKCYGMELDPKYCQVIVDRMLKLDPTIEIKRNGQPYKKI